MCRKHLTTFGTSAILAHVTTDLLTTSQAANYAGVHRMTINRWSQQGILPVAATLPGGARRYRRADLESLLQLSPDQGASGDAG